MAIDTIDITPTRCRFNGGQFDSDFRYIRETASAGVRSTLLAGPSIAVVLQSSSWRVSWRFECGGYALSGKGEDGAAPPSNVANTPTNIAL
jgi:hypothetical protein